MMRITVLGGRTVVDGQFRGDSCSSGSGVSFLVPYGTVIATVYEERRAAAYKSRLGEVFRIMIIVVSAA